MWHQRWNPDFEAEHDLPLALVWVQLPQLPYHLHDWECLKKIGSTLGDPLSMDVATTKRNRPSLAKIRVEVDLTKPLIHQVWIGHEEEGAPLKGFFQRIEYDYVPKYCTHCKKLGHSNSLCRILQNAKKPEATSKLASSKGTTETDEQKKGATTLMEQQRKSGEKEDPKKVLPTTQNLGKQEENKEKQVTNQPLVVQSEKGKKVAVEPQVVLTEKGNCSKEKKGKKHFINQKKKVWKWRPKEKNQQQANVKDALHGPKQLLQENEDSKNRKPKRKMLPQHMLGPKIVVSKQKFKKGSYNLRKYKVRKGNNKIKLHKRLTRKREKGKAKNTRASSSAKYNSPVSSDRSHEKVPSVEGFYQKAAAQEEQLQLISYKKVEPKQFKFNLKRKPLDLRHATHVLGLMKQRDAAAEQRSFIFPPGREQNFQFGTINNEATVSSPSLQSMQGENVCEETHVVENTQAVSPIKNGEGCIECAVENEENSSNAGIETTETPKKIAAQKTQKRRELHPFNSAPITRSKTKLTEQTKESQDEEENDWQTVPLSKWKQRMKKKMEMMDH